MVVIKGVFWNIVFFLIGMYVVVYGFQNVGLIILLLGVIIEIVKGGWFVVIMGMGYLVVFLLLLMNNMLIVMINVLLIKGVDVLGFIYYMLVYVNIIGLDLGFKIILIGFLVILVWLYVLV